MTKKFKIDFFELAFLTEACIPQVPIARYSFFQSVINEHWHEMTWEERERLFEWISKNDKIHNGEELCNIFLARFNPDKQYIVEAENEKFDCFLFNKHYYISVYRSISESFITKITKRFHPFITK